MVKDVQKIMDGGTTKVAMLGCEDCYYRYGKNWAVERLLKKKTSGILQKVGYFRDKIIYYKSV